ncbi:hypothetical protein Ahy_A01g002832 [Arachis hypogaea]|uniref:FAR1 domain-containing protein n=1 Tax=Arachis hypogaea TaxID=3818 RepID=A0A445ERH6_ARAHY|nr:hypothetical protein Ahy_A01g002832 [Arachis hypogaea]
MERRYPLLPIFLEGYLPILRVLLNYRIVVIWHRVARDEDISGGVCIAEEAEMYDGADHGVGLVEGEGFEGIESDDYELHEDETGHDHHAEADVDSADVVELEDNLDNIGGMSDNFADDDLYAIDCGKSINSIDFLNLSEEEVFRFNFADFYQQYAKHHGFGVRRSRSEKCGEEFVCHRQGYRSRRFYSIPNQQKRPKDETQCGCPARMHVCIDDESEHWHVAYFSDAHNPNVLELRFSSTLLGHQRMSEADIEQMNDMRNGGLASCKSMILWRA